MQLLVVRQIITSDEQQQAGFSRILSSPLNEGDRITVTDIMALYNEADQLKDAGKYDEAVAKLNDILAQDESHVLAHMALAVVLGKLGRYDESVQHGERACELEPDDAFNFTALSITYQRAFAGTQNQAYIPAAEQAMAKSQALAYQQRQQQQT